MAKEGQLHFVKRPLWSLSTLESSETASLWWPSLLFNNFDEFQDFFQVKFVVNQNELTVVIVILKVQEFLFTLIPQRSQSMTLRVSEDVSVEARPHEQEACC